MTENVVRHPLNMTQYTSFQNLYPDEVSLALAPVLLVQRAIKEVLTEVPVVGRTILHLRTAVSAVDHTGENAALACPGHAVTLVTNLLNLFKHIIVNNALMCIREDSLIFHRIQMSLFIPDRVSIGLEVDCAASVLPAFQNQTYCSFIPAVRVFRGRCVCTPAMAQLVGGGSQNFVHPQLVCNLGRATSLHAHGEDALHNRSRFRVNKPMLRVLRVFHIAVGDIDRQRYSTLSLGLLDSPNLAAGIAGVKLVEPVLNARKIVVYAVRVNGVVIVVNGNVANAILGKGEVCVQTRQGRVAPQSGQVFCDNDSYTPCFDLDQHTLKAGAVIVRAGVAIIHKEHWVREVDLFGVFQKDSLLVLNGQAFAEPCVLLRQSAVKCGDLIRCSRHCCVLLTLWSNCQYRIG